MEDQLLKVMQRNYLVDIMYISKSEEITKRRVKIIKMIGDTFHAYCFMKHAKRTFKIDSVLAVAPVVHKEREVM